MNCMVWRAGVRWVLIVLVPGHCLLLAVTSEQYMYDVIASHNHNIKVENIQKRSSIIEMAPLN